MISTVTVATGEERWHSSGPSLREVRAEALEEHCLLAHSVAPCKTLYKVQAHLTGDAATYGGLGPPVSILSQDSLSGQSDLGNHSIAPTSKLCQVDSRN